MSQVKVSGNASGTGVFEIAAPNSNNNYTLTLPTATTTLVGTDATQTLTNKTINGGALQSGTAVASTSGTSIDFTGIPSWVKRITVMFNGVSTNGTSRIQILLGTSGGFVSSGYTQYGGYAGASQSGSSNTTGFLFDIAASPSASDFRNGAMILYNISGNTWVETHTGGLFSISYYFYASGGNITLASALTQVRVTTVNGTDTFDAGSINILYE